MAFYRRFLGMISVSTAVMLCLMYFNTFSLGHIHWSETRFYMAMLMGAAMSVVMLAFMWKMARNTRINLAILVSAGIVFFSSLALVRSQVTIDDVSWMKAMIPHHSIAILTSERAHLSDPRAQKLANDIAETQRREIADMEDLIRDLESR